MHLSKTLAPPLPPGTEPGTRTPGPRRQIGLDPGTLAPIWPGPRTFELRVRRLHEAFLGARALTPSSRVGAFGFLLWLDSTLEFFSLKTLQTKTFVLLRVNLARVRGCEICGEADRGGCWRAVLSPRPRRCHPRKSASTAVCACVVCTVYRQAYVHCAVVLQLCSTPPWRDLLLTACIATPASREGAHLASFPPAAHLASFHRPLRLLLANVVVQLRRWLARAGLSRWWVLEAVWTNRIKKRG